jgi:hypothetical protein
MAEITREYRGAHATLEVLDADLGYQIPTEDRPFEGISADVKGGEHSVWIAFASREDDHFTHGIPNAQIVRALSASDRSGPVIEVEATDGAITLLALTRPEQYALPDPSARAQPKR